MRFQMRLHPEYDADVIAWLDAQADKTEAVKALIRSPGGVQPQAGSPAAVDLAAIRQVFEAVIAEKLGGAALAVTASESGDPELERKLDEMF